MLGQRPGVVADLFAGGEGVQVPAQRLKTRRDGAGVAALGALEHHVLDEVRHAVVFLLFVARTNTIHGKDRGRLGVLIRHEQNAHAVL